LVQRRIAQIGHMPSLLSTRRFPTHLLLHEPGGNLFAV
jgi:hypothetical protein